MDPIELTQSKCAALQTLGLSGAATPDVIRSTWRRIAFRTHPDRPDGSLPDFLAAKAAYDLLTDPGSTARPSGPRRPARSEPARPDPARPEPASSEQVRPTRARRPRVTRRIIETTDSARAECRALLEGRQADSAADHFAGAVECEGRCLIFHVSTPMAAGLNRVAVPTAILEDRRKVKPRIVSLQASQSGPARVKLPEALCEAYFPGARSVEIRFGTEVSAEAV